MSSFIEPERSTTKQISRGLLNATAEAVALNVLTPKMRPKNVPLLPVELSRRVVTLMAFRRRLGVNVRAFESQRPYWISLVLKVTFYPPAL